MQNDVLARVAALPRMPMPELSALWKELFQVEAPKYNKNHLIKRIAYRLQEIAYNVDSALIDKRLEQYSSSLYGWIDDLYICDGTGITNNDFLGDCRVDTLYPNGVGNSAQFTPTGSAANWENVKDTTIDEDTTNNASATAGQIDSFAFGDLSNLGSSVFGVQNNLLAKKDDAGTRTMRSITRIGSTNHESGDFSLGTTYLDYLQIQETNPATAAAWTVDAINGAEFGYKVQA